MDFELVLKALLTEFDRHQIRYAAIGAFALGFLGDLGNTLSPCWRGQEAILSSVRGTRWRPCPSRLLNCTSPQLSP